jgi:hypothetical protein
MKRVCGCCETPARPTPLAVENRPALDAIAYRIGTYSAFRQAMLSAIASAPELIQFSTRRDDDYGITIIDLWAAVADVLTFYQERYANEAFLRTSEFRDSIARLVALIGYKLRPGVAARATIAFTLDKDKRLLVPAGQKIQSVPEAGQQPQTFETLAELSADSRLNRLRVFSAPTTVNPLQAGTVKSYLDRLQGPQLAAGVAQNDNIVFFDDGATAAAEEKKIAATGVEDDRVFLVWAAPLKTTWSASTRVRKSLRTFRLFGYNAPTQFLRPNLANISRITWTLVNDAPALSARLTFQLDAKYDTLAPGRKLLIADTDSAGRKTLVTVEAVRQVTATYMGVTDTVTEIQVSRDSAPGTNVPAIGSRRKVVIYELDGPALLFDGALYPTPIDDATIYLPGVAVAGENGMAIEVGRTIQRNAFQPGVVIDPDEIEKGRSLLLGDASGHLIAATIKQAPELSPATPAAGQFCHLVLALQTTSAIQLDARSAFVLGNIADASHGESVLNEIVGDGDASLRFQRLALRKKPLTYLAGTSTEALASTLTLRANGVQWKEVPQLYGQASTARVFEIFTTDDGGTILQFGDGKTGASLPTGRANVTASYRTGVGLSGRVDANALTTLLQKPVGLSAATNPLPAEGGADPEQMADARRHAPRTVRTFGRIVSLEDFEDQVTASGEVAKASATMVWDGLDRAIHLTIAGQEGALFSDQARRDLGDSLKLVRDPNHGLRIDNYVRIAIEFHAAVAVLPEYEPDIVLAAARQAVLDALAFDARSLGEPVYLSDLIRVVQDVEGVSFVDVNRLLFKKPAGMSNLMYLFFLAARGAAFLSGGGGPNSVQPRLRIFGARPHKTIPGKVLPAELAYIENGSADVVITPGSE